MTAISIPFVKGAQQAGDRNAESESGKLATALNVHVSPTHKDVLSARPRFVNQAAAAPGRPTDCNGAILVGTAQGIYIHDPVTGSSNPETGFNAVVGLSDLKIDTLKTPYFSQETAAYTFKCSGCDSANSVLKTWVVWSNTVGVARIGVSTFSGPRRQTAYIDSFVVLGASTPANMFGVTCAANDLRLVYSDGTDLKYVSELTGLSVGTLIAGGVTAVHDVQRMSNGTIVMLTANGLTLTYRVFTSDLSAQTGSVSFPALGGGSTDINAIVVESSQGPTQTAVWVSYTLAGSSRVFVRAMSGVVLGAVSAELVNPFVSSCNMQIININPANLSASGSVDCLLVARGVAETVAYSMPCKANYNGAAFTMPSLLLFNVPAIPISTSRDGLVLATNSGSALLLCDFTGNTVNVSPKIAAHLDSQSTLQLPQDTALTKYGHCRRNSAKFGVYGCHVVPTIVVGGVCAKLVWYTLGPVRAAGGEILGASPRYPWNGAGAPNGFIPYGISQVPGFSLAPSGTGLTGVYTYALVFQVTLPDGTQVNSPPKFQTIVLANQGCAVTYFPHTFPVSMWLGRQVDIAIYRSVAGDTQTRLIYTNKQGFQMTGLTPPIIITDTVPDSQAALGEQLPTQAELAADTMPPANVSVVYDARKICLSLVDPRRCYYTKSKKQGRPYEWNPLLTFSAPSDLVTIAVQDGNMYAFGTSTIWATSVSFANDDGTGTSEARFASVSSGIGCDQFDSVVSTPVGIFFANSRGIHVLPRGGGAPAYVGEDIEATFLAYPLISGAAVNVSTHEVAWMCSSGTAHRVLVYNWQIGQWFVWRLWDNTASLVFDYGIACASGRWVVSSNGVKVLAVSRLLSAPVGGSVGDNDFDGSNNDLVSLQVETADTTVAKFGEFCRVTKVIAEASWQATDAASGISASESHDGGQSYNTPVVFLLNGADPLQYHFTVQKTRGFRFKLTTTEPVRFNGLTLYVTPNGRARTHFLGG